MFPLYNKKNVYASIFFWQIKELAMKTPVKYKSDWKMSAYKLLFKYTMYYQ